MGVPLIMLDKWNDLKALEMKDLILLNKNNVIKIMNNFVVEFWTNKLIIQK